MLLKEIILQTNHLALVHAFYQEVLLLPVMQYNSKTVAIAAGQTKLVFQAGNSSVNPFYHFAFNIPSNKIEEALYWLRDKIELPWMEDYKGYIAEFTNWHARSVYFIDPAGNIVEFIARFDLNDDASEQFSASQIRNISEIGLVFSNAEFDKQVKKLLGNFHLAYFLKQQPMPQFRAIGDDEGLFITVPEYRNWYPTDTPCGIFPLSVKFENAKSQYHLNF
jgi:hypothetical protein